MIWKWYIYVLCVLAVWNVSLNNFGSFQSPGNFVPNSVSHNPSINCTYGPDMSGSQNMGHQYNINTQPSLSGPAQMNQSNFTRLSNGQLSAVSDVNNGNCSNPSMQNDQMYGSLHGLIQQMNNMFSSRFDMLDHKVSKLERDVSFTRTDVARLQQENSELRHKVFEMEKSCATISSLYDEYKNKVTKSADDINFLRRENVMLKSDLNEF